ncbi:hypothetical protein PoB_000743900 [Plakobranchus ocellatus]|uniref:Uncharacterized protein n=1 Tax=Plakobranchus ocellatus TaxID=259542 RepID=A0AAV3YFV3_9GAST|nr:hypothetical protein PoB_000743900 [Plakobranchus ocellatus]
MLKAPLSNLIEFNRSDLRLTGKFSSLFGWFLYIYIACSQQGDLRFQVFRRARAPVVRLEPATEGSLQISGRTRQPLCHWRPSSADRKTGREKGRGVGSRVYSQSGLRFARFQSQHQHPGISFSLRAWRIVNSCNAMVPPLLTTLRANPHWRQQFMCPTIHVWKHSSFFGREHATSAATSTLDWKYMYNASNPDLR